MQRRGPMASRVVVHFAVLFQIFTKMFGLANIHPSQPWLPLSLCLLRTIAIGENNHSLSWRPSWHDKRSVTSTPHEVKFPPSSLLMKILLGKSQTALSQVLKVVLQDKK